MKNEHLRIIELRAENVKRLRAVTIKPGGDVVTLSGKNGQGKTSVLDAITYALAGKSAMCPEPVRRGEDRAEVVCDLGEYIVKRTFTAAGGTSVVVSSREGARFPSPQALLDKLTGNLTFDPLAFSREDPKKQVETLRQAIGVDFTGLDKERADLYAKRREVGIEGRALRVQFDALPVHDDAPDAETSTASVLADQSAAQEKNRQNDQQRRGAEELARGVAEQSARLEAEEQRLEELEKTAASLRDAIKAGKADVRKASEVAKAADEKAQALVDVDLSSFSRRLQEVEGLNRVFREASERARIGTKLEALNELRGELTASIDAVDRKKAEAIASADLPVEGLSMSDDHGVTFNGVPFEQASAAEQLRVSVAMGIAMNPTLRVLLIRDASLLDEDSLALISAMAAKNDMQVWLERVEDDAETAIVIEDGGVVGAEPVQEGGAE